MKKRIYLNYIRVLQERIDSKSGLVQVILGPRQVGKTTTTLKLLEEQYKNASTYVSADTVFNADSGWLRENWLQALQDNKILVIDEIQKCFNWAEAIKSLYDETKKDKKTLTCIVLGSSSLEIQRASPKV
jgi:predicted AAA+ superfamily ATPase